MHGHPGLLAGLVAEPVGQDPQSLPVILVRDLHLALSGNPVAEAVAAFNPEAVAAALVELDRLAGDSARCRGRDGVLARRAFTHLPADGGQFEHLQLSVASPPAAP